MDKQIVVYPYNGVLLDNNSNRNELLTPQPGWITESKSVVAQSKGRDDSKGAQGNFGVMEICIFTLLFILIMVVVALV